MENGLTVFPVLFKGIHSARAKIDLAKQQNGKPPHV